MHVLKQALPPSPSIPTIIDDSQGSPNTEVQAVSEAGSGNQTDMEEEPAKFAHEALQSGYPKHMQDRDGLDSAETLFHKESLRHAYDKSKGETARAVAAVKSLNKQEKNARKRAVQKNRRAAQKTAA